MYVRQKWAQHHTRCLNNLQHGCVQAVGFHFGLIFAADNFVSFESTPSKDFPGLFQPDLTARRWKAIEFTLHRYLCCDSQDLEVYCTAYGKAQLSADAPKR